MAPSANLAASVPDPVSRPWEHAHIFGFTLDPITDCDVPKDTPPPEPLARIEGVPMLADWYPDAVPTDWASVPPIQWDSTSAAFKAYAQEYGTERAQAAYIAELSGVYGAGAICHVETPTRSSSASARTRLRGNRGVARARRIGDSVCTSAS